VSEKKQQLTPAALVERMLQGDTLSLGRVIKHLENGDDDAFEMVRIIHQHTGRAHRIGLTGVPGGGKSTLVDKLTAVFRKEGATVGIIAVDPSSPFTGGAVLGDRVRMQQHYLDRGVFIRSMATRGNSGGLPKTIGEVADAMDASGKDVILIETVGVGQSELDIIKNVDTVVVVLAPGLGDGIQAMKAGVLEIANIFVINKDDQPGALELTLEINNMVSPSNWKTYWNIPVPGDHE
jgi:LAO/AO transport system kinase